jgi:hypothetical protein
MKSTSAILIACCLLSASFSSAEEPYDFRQSEAYSKLSAPDRNRLEQVHRDFMMLWGALDRYADNHDGRLPDTLDQLVPNYLSELPRDPFATAESAKEEAKWNVKSKEGWGYRYRKGAPGNRAWVLSSVGLRNFPYVAAHGNIDLYVCKGIWISGRNPSETHTKEPGSYVVGRPVYRPPQTSKDEGPFADVLVPSAKQGRPEVAATQPKRGWGPEQATGAPDTRRAGDLQTAWASLQPDAGLEWLQLEYQRPVEIAEVRIRETFNPGAVSKVVALVENGQERVLWEGQDPTDSAPADFVVRPKIRATTNRVKIYLQTTRRPGWNEIDAVELIGADGSRQWASSASASSTFAESNPYANGSTWARSPGTMGRSYIRLEDTQLRYETYLGKSAKVHLEGGQSLEGVFCGIDSQFVTLQQQQGNKTLLVNKARVAYIEIVGK